MNAFMMTGGGPDNSTTMIGLLIYKNAFEYSKYRPRLRAGDPACYRHRASSRMLQFKLMGVDVEY